MKLNPVLPEKFQNFISITFQCKNHGWFDIKPLDNSAAEHKSRVIGYGNAGLQTMFSKSDVHITFDNVERARCPVDNCDKILAQMAQEKQTRQPFIYNKT